MSELERHDLYDMWVVEHFFMYIASVDDLQYQLRKRGKKLID